MSRVNAVQLAKRFDYSVSNEFNRALVEALAGTTPAENNVVLDCAQMDYIDSAGIGLLVMGHKKAQSVHATLSLVNLKPSAREILLLANLQKLIEFK